MKPREIVDKMYRQDPFSQWLGITIEEVGLGHCLLKMTVRPEMTNGFGIAHGGITYALADSAFAFASNSHGRHAVSIESSISHFRKISANQTLFAEAIEEHRSHKTATYRVEVFSLAGEKLALFKGVVYRSSKEWV